MEARAAVTANLIYCSQNQSAYSCGKLLKSVSYQEKRRSVFHKEILHKEEKLCKASEKGNVDEVHHLPSGTYVLDVNFVCVEGYHLSTPLKQAAYFGHKGLVKALLDRRAYVDKEDGYEHTPLHLAAHKGHIDEVQLFPDRGANPNRANLMVELCCT